MTFIIYLNVKYFPVRVSMLRELNQQLAFSNRHQIRITRKSHITTNKQINDKQTFQYKPTSQRVTRQPVSKTTATLKKRRTFICIRYIGGLGNIMFLYASAYGLSWMKGMDLVIPKDNDLFRIFHLGASNLRIVANYKLCKGVVNYGDRQNCAFNKQFLKLSNQTSFWISGYLQSYKYFEAFFDDLRSQFTFKKHIQDEANRILSNVTKTHLQAKNAKKLNLTVIGIHIRRGDMVGNKYGYTVGTKEYFLKAMEWFRSKYRNTAFVVCSNDISWCKNNLRGKDIYFVEKRPREIDMAVLATCDHLISSVGSFSWWASWLCKGTVTYFFPPAVNGSDLRRQYSEDYSDYFLQKWIHF